MCVSQAGSGTDTLASCGKKVPLSHIEYHRNMEPGVEKHVDRRHGNPGDRDSLTSDLQKICVCYPVVKWAFLPLLHFPVPGHSPRIQKKL